MLIALHYLAAALGGIIIILAFVGLGRIVQRFTHEGGTISEAIALGFAVNLLIGGLLNLVEAISLGTVLAVELVGLSGLYFERHKLAYEIKSYYKEPYAIAILAVFYILSVTNVVFNWNDDFNGYLIIVEKIIQTHHLGSDPFLDFRLYVGSYSYAQAFYVIQLGYEHLSLLDPGVGRLIIGLLLIERFEKYFGAYRYLMLLLLMSGLIVAWSWNVTSPLAIITALLALLSFEVVDGKNRPFLFGLMAGAVVSLKVSALPYVSLLAIIWFFSIARGGQVWYSFRAVLLAALSGVAILLPWMVSSYSSSGTLMFPVLGLGYHAFSVSFFDWRVLWHLLKTNPEYGHFVFGILLVLSGGMLLTFKSKKPTRWIIASVTAGALLSMSLILYKAGTTPDTFRYIVPICGALGIVALVRFIDAKVLRTYRAKLVFVTLALATAVSLIPPRHFLMVNKNNALAVLRGRTYLLGKAYSRRRSLREAQNLVPEHERILTLTDTASMLDFVRNPIWATGDNPGESSPPPGLLNLNSSSELRNYLLSLGISYVLFEPHTEKFAAIEKRMASPTQAYLHDPWDYNTILAMKHVLQSVARLAENSIVQRSDDYEVIELISPSTDKP